eukprot:TRINITY_DN60210_c0_g1_i1.p2 TRINITY_DN60210_c0_g1~~TRINITY_DN60210_c0_g1_i1.p2  ORF type:complete len:484 (+),score=144.07 TRINITY_DN60210_c0_g1_i1:70-1452(+)
MRGAVLACLAVAAGAAPPPGQNTSTRAEIVNTCYRLLESHECRGSRWGLPYHFYRPALEKYGPSQWLWDSGSHMIVWSHRNVSNAVADLRSMLQMQQPSGFVPEMIFWEENPNPLQYGNYTKFTPITQMPVLAFSLRAIYNATQDAGLLRELVPRLAEYWRWWGRERDLRGRGLVSIIHGWESGLDASPMYDRAYGIKDAGPVTEALYLRMYPKFVELIESYNVRYGWNLTKIVSRDHAPPGPVDAWFFVEDVGVNAVWIRGWEVLADLADHFDPGLAAECRATAARLLGVLLEDCWSADLGRFVAWWRRTDGGWETTPAESVQTLFPLMLDLPEQQRVAVVAALTNTSKFWTAYPVPSVSRDSPTFTPGFSEKADLMWRGPTWAFPNWFVLEGLLRHSAADPALRGVAVELVARWAEAVRISGIWEQYNPLTAGGVGTVGLGMSTLIVDAMARVGMVQP